MDFEKVAVKVYGLLTDLPECRDDDRLLMAEIWGRETGAISVAEFFDEFVGAKISHPESIRRMRQKIQEKHESLRGDKWEARHGMEAAVCDQLSFFDLW